MSDELERLYELAWYRVDAEVPFILRVGQNSDELQGLYLEQNCRSAAFLTAWNPNGVKISDTLNRRAQHLLLADTLELGITGIAATGLDSTPGSDWPGEPSIFLPGITKQDATRLAAKYRQLAFLWCPVSAIPELVMHPRQITETQQL